MDALRRSVGAERGGERRKTERRPTARGLTPKKSCAIERTKASGLALNDAIYSPISKNSIRPAANGSVTLTSRLQIISSGRAAPIAIKDEKNSCAI